MSPPFILFVIINLIELPWESKVLLSPSEIDSALLPDYGFGWQVAISNGTALVGSMAAGAHDTSTDQQSSPDVGSARVFTHTDSTPALWSQQALLIADDGNGPYRGYTTALDGDTALVGLYKYNTTDCFARAAFFFRSADVWDSGTVFTLEETTCDVRGFVPRVAIDGDTAVISLWNNGFYITGKAWVFARNAAGEWSQEAVLVDADGGDGDRFGDSVAISGNTVIVGASQRMAAPGKVYVYTRSGVTWSQEAMIHPQGSTLADNALGYGWDVALDGDTLLVGCAAGGEFAPSGEYIEGFVDVYTRSSGVWTLQTQLYANFVQSPDGFGRSVSLKGDRALVGAHKENDWNGAAYLFERSGDSWEAVKKVDGEGVYGNGMQFGNRVALDIDGTALIAADGGDSFDQVGYVLVYDDFTVVPVSLIFNYFIDFVAQSLKIPPLTFILYNDPPTLSPDHG